MSKLNQHSLWATLAILLFAGTVNTTEQQQTSAQKDQKSISPPAAKPSAPISMQYKVLTASPKPGEEIEIEVSFNSPIKSPIKSNLTSAKKLTWMNSNKSWQSVVSKSGRREAMPRLKVIAPEDGIYYLHFVATVEIEGKLLAKPFTIPVQVGEGPFELEPVGEVIIDDKGQKVIIQEGESDNRGY